MVVKLAADFSAYDNLRFLWLRRKSRSRKKTEKEAKEERKEEKEE